MKAVGKVAGHLKRHLLWYALSAIGLGWGVGLLVPQFIQANQSVLNVLITGLVFLMIYPMMISMDLTKIPGVFKKPRPIVLAVVYNFVVTPLLSLLFVSLFLHDPEIAMGFMLVMLIPGSSMSLGYTGLVEGSMELATVAMGFIFLLIPILLPFFISFLGATYHVAIPLDLLLGTVGAVLILPLIAGDLTRRGVIKARGVEGYNRAKPLFSLVTMVTMLLMVSLIFALKAPTLVKQTSLVLSLAGITFLYLAIMFVLMTFGNKLFKITYGEHMAIAFLSTGKNNGTAIAIAMLAFSPMVAIPAAILPVFQIIFSIGYVSLAPRIKEYFFGREKKAVPSGRQDIERELDQKLP